MKTKINIPPDSKHIITLLVCFLQMFFSVPVSLVGTMRYQLSDAVSLQRTEGCVKRVA